METRKFMLEKIAEGSIPLAETTVQDNIQNQIILKKIKAIRNQIENLLNKKIRIDLEIKKQQEVLKGIKKRASKELKLSASIETVANLNLMLEKHGFPPISEDLSSDIELKRLEEIESRIQKLKDSGAFSYLD